MTPFSCKPAQHRSVHVLSKYSRDSFFLSSLCCVQCYPVVPLTCPHSRPHSRPHFRLYSKLYSRLYSRPHSRLYICMAVAGQGWRMLHKRMLHKRMLHWLEEVTLHITLHILHCIYYAAYITLHILRCIYYTAYLHCIYCTAYLHCIYCTAYITLSVVTLRRN